MAAKPWIVPPLELPVGDKTYTIRPVGYATGLEVQDVMNQQHASIKVDSADADFFALVMGDTWAEMQADDQPYPVMLRAGLASIQYQVALVTGMDPEAAVGVAEATWEAKVDPEALAAAMTAAQNDQKTISTRSTSTASGRKTRSPASTKTTTSRRATPRTGSSRKPAKATRSAGVNSGKPSGSTGTT